MEKKEFIKSFTLSELKSALLERGFEGYRASQVFHSVFVEKAVDFSEISTLPLNLRMQLNEVFQLDSLTLIEKRESSDGSVKFLFGLHDGHSVESVLIPDNTGKRLTICISTQAGCALGCAFCATGRLGLKRNLQASEIIDQYILAEQHTGNKITNIVLMGMGEPLHNLENVLKAIEIISCREADIISPKRITISTVGIIPGIRKLTDAGAGVKLALSLHATTNGQREMIIPVAKKWKLGPLLEALEDFYRRTRSAVTYEYILFEGFNDSAEDAKRLAKFTRRFPSKVNIIPFNDISHAGRNEKIELKPASKEKIASFVSLLKMHGAEVFVRDSFGSDIEAACGQLALSKE